MYQIIREQIISGQRKPSERLLEMKIAEELGVSRSPVREALRMLEQEGLLISCENGLAVYPMKFGEMEEIYQCRMATEPFAAFLATYKLNAEDLNNLDEFINQAGLAYQRESYQEVVEFNTKFHDLITKSSGNQRIIKIIESLKSFTILSRNTELRVYRRPIDYLLEHKLILQALKNRDSDLVNEIMRMHIENDWLFLKKFLNK